MNINRWRIGRVHVWTAGAVALAIIVVALIVDARVVAATFLVAYAATVSVVLGTLAMTLIAPRTTATWFGAVRRDAERITSSLPALAAMGALLILSVPVLYPWVRVPTAARAYLNVPFFVARSVIYWTSWITIAEQVRATKRIEARGEVARAARRYRMLSAGGLIVLGVTMTFAAFDWMMSLTPDWYSTIYGLYWIAGSLVGGLALIAVLARVRGRRLSLAALVQGYQPSLGALLIAFILFWLYIGFAQYIVIWSGNLPREVAWYIPRTKGAWANVALVLLLGQFVFPFLALLPTVVRRSGVGLAVIGAVLLAGRYVDIYWVVIPGLIPVTWWTLVVSVATATVVVAVTGAASAARSAS